MAVVKTVLGALVIPLAVASGCAMTPVPNEKDLVDALTDDLSFAQKQIIETKISDWFGGIKITLADDVFSESSQVKHTWTKEDYLLREGTIIPHLRLPY